ncbi:hypothetical protein PO909_014461 [Leuciscus waleckii]
MELDSVQQTACLTEECVQSLLTCLSMLKSRVAVPRKHFQRLLGHMAAAAVVIPLGLLHMRQLQHWLHDQVPRGAWHSGTFRMSSSLYTRPHTKNWTEIRIDSDVNSLKRALIQLKKTLDGTLNEKLSQTVSTGLEFVQEFAVDVTLDPDSANSYLILSDDGKQVSDGDIEQGVPENPKRFDVGLCVLAKEGFSSGRFYYEVQVKGKTGWCLGVIRESIKRKRTITLKPEDGFWTVILRNENQYVACEHPFVFLSLRVKPEKVGVFVDYEEGLVSFYDVGSRSHIYSFTGQTFTKKLYPFFSPCDNDEDDEPCWSSSSILGSQVLWRHNFSWICQWFYWRVKSDFPQTDRQNIR